jgi:Anti-sigma-K factor rskA
MFTPGKWQEVVVSLGNLPPLPPDQVYRMWLTLKNGQVLPCGEFKTTPEGTVFIRINPPKTPPTGVKATGVFVTVDAANAPLTPTGQQVMTGSI